METAYAELARLLSGETEEPAQGNEPTPEEASTLDLTPLDVEDDEAEKVPDDGLDEQDSVV